MLQLNYTHLHALLVAACIQIHADSHNSDQTTKALYTLTALNSFIGFHNNAKKISFEVTN